MNLYIYLRIYLYLPLPIFMNLYISPPLYLIPIHSSIHLSPSQKQTSSSSSRDNSLADDVKSWKSAVSTRHYEAKLQGLDDLCAKKVPFYALLFFLVGIWQRVFLTVVF